MNILYGNDIGVYNFLLSDILEIGLKGQKYTNCISQNIDISQQKKIFRKILKQISISKSKTLNCLYNKYIKEYETYSALNGILCQQYSANCYINNIDELSNAYNKRDNVLRKILGFSPDTKLRNTSEITLYKIVKDIFSDAIYQYRTSWLGKQSLDIYIPSKLIAIEYQGKQHYEPIDYFGGLNSFLIQKERDNKKKLLCHEHNITLIEWKYTDIISTNTLLKKINEAKNGNI